MRNKRKKETYNTVKQTKEKQIQHHFNIPCMLFQADLPLLFLLRLASNQASLSGMRKIIMYYVLFVYGFFFPFFLFFLLENGFAYEKSFESVVAFDRV